MKIVFFGTPAFAVPTFEALLRSSHQVVGVVTRHDRPRDRGHRVTDAPIKARALAAGVAILQPERLNEAAFLESLAALGADLGVVAAYGKILTETVLTIPRRGMINVHGSLLPRYRGAAPIHRAIIDGARETGITIMRVVRALDAGPMLATARRPIGEDETSEEVERDLARLGAELLVPVVDALAADRVSETPQDEALATYANRLTREDGIVDWHRPAMALHNLIRGLHPWPHAVTHYRGRRLILLRSQVHTLPVTSGDGASPAERTAAEAAAASGADFPEPGTILGIAADRLLVATGDGVLGITQLQAEGRRPMTAREFLAGTRLAVGDVLSSP